MPTPVILSGIFGAPIEALATLLSNVTAFQTFTGTVSAVLAKARIYEIFEAETSVTRPLALITYQQGSWSADRDAASSGNGSFRRDSSLTLVFEKSVTAYGKDDIKTFANEIGSIIQGIMDLSGTNNNYMLVKTITLNGFSRGEEGEDKTLYADFKITWGM